MTVAELLASAPEPTPCALTDLRIRRGLTQQHVAALVHAGLRTINRWESGQHPIPRAERELLWLKMHG